MQKDQENGKVVFEVGDTAYFANGTGVLQPGKIIKIFEHYNDTLYVLEVDTHVDSYYECRTYRTLSDDPNKPLLWLRMARKVNVVAP